MQRGVEGMLMRRRLEGLILPNVVYGTSMS